MIFTDFVQQALLVVAGRSADRAGTGSVVGSTSETTKNHPDHGAAAVRAFLGVAHGWLSPASTVSSARWIVGAPHRRQTSPSPGGLDLML